jgi:betaine-homocysteine S-methyltransferase
MTISTKAGLIERLEVGAVICAEGYLFEFERRGYLTPGSYVPEIVLEHPELVAGLHREIGRSCARLVASRILSR